MLEPFGDWTGKRRVESDGMKIVFLLRKERRMSFFQAMSSSTVAAARLQSSGFFVTPFDIFSPRNVEMGTGEVRLLTP